MAKLRRTTSGVSAYGVVFECPGCNERHAVPTLPREHGWTFNEDVDRPTLRPSILFHGDQRGALPGFRCHSFVTDGRIQFLADSTHSLAGQTVDLPDV